MSTKVTVISIIAVLVGYFILVPVLNWEINRRVKYELDYKSQVKETIQEMVKPECLSEKK
jgi:hypothetical protein